MKFKASSKQGRFGEWNKFRQVTKPGRKELGREEDPGLLTVVFFLLCHRCNVEKVPSNSQLEIEGNRSGSVLYSCVSKCRYLSVHETNWFIESTFGNKFFWSSPSFPTLAWGIQAQMLLTTCHGFKVGLCCVLIWEHLCGKCVLQRWWESCKIPCAACSTSEMDFYCLLAAFVCCAGIWTLLSWHSGLM